MDSLKRNLCLLLTLSLLAPGLAFPAFADESTDAVQTTETSVESSSSETSDSTQTNSEDFSSSSGRSEESTETTTEIHETTSGAGGTASTTEESVPDETVASEESTTTPPIGEVGTTTPSTDDIAPTTLPVETIATTSATTTGTEGTTTPALSVEAATTTASTTITTGDAAAGANVINVTGANFVNSSGSVVLGNYFTPTDGVDLRTATSSFETGALCILFACTGGQGVSLNLEGTSTIDNALILSALSGDNTLTGPGNSTISTGNAYVGLNLINLANLNVVDSAYLIAALNLFQGLSGDLVFPSLAGFFSSLASAAPSASSLDSLATVDNDIVFSTETGANQSDATSTSITTGNTRAMGTLLNSVNGNDIGGSSLAIILRITGTWNGEVWGAPSGFSIVHGDDGGIYLMSDAARSALIGDTELNATSTALITNHANLTAATGGNGIFGADSARIMTGNALAAANVLTLANQNIVGRNWLTAVINIFGDWNGNLAFGRPDLQVGERVEAPTPLADGSEVTIHFMIVNAGDAEASNSTFTATLDGVQLEVLDGESTQNLGTLAPGASTEVVYRARVHAAPGAEIATGGSATSHETDNNVADNSDSVTLHIPGSGGGGGSQSLASQSFHTSTADSEKPLMVTRHTAYTTLTDTTRTVHQEIVVSNPNDATTTPVDLHDLLIDPSGTTVQDQAWPLDTLAPHEEVTVSYDIVFGGDAPSGLYQLSTILATDTGDLTFARNGSILIAGITALTPVAHAGEVAGVATSTEPVVVRSVPPANLAAAAAADVPWTYALGFVVSFVLLIGFLWMASRILRK